MKRYLLALLFAIFTPATAFGATIFLTNTSDTINTFRTNVNTSLTNLNNAFGSSPFNFGSSISNYSTSTVSTTTSIWTQGVFFSSSTKQASQFPYASSTAFTVSDLFATNATTTFLFAALSSTTQLFANNATSTFLFTSNASTSIFWGAQLSSCTGSGSKITWASGTFRCETDQTGNNAPQFTVTFKNTWSTTTLATTSSIWTQGVFFASSTSFSIFPYASTTAITAVTASTTNLYVSSAPNALALMGVDGLLGKYGGAAACTNQVVTAISSVGATTCTSVANAMLTNSSVTVTAGTGMAGGGAVALGSAVTLYQVSNVSTSTSPTTNFVPYWTNTNGTPASLGSDTDLQFDGGKMTVTSASSTNLTASGFFGIPFATSLTLIASGQLGVNTNSIASSSLDFYDGTAQRHLPDVRDMRVTFINYPTNGTGTTTIPVPASIHGFTVVGAYCWSMEGSTNKFTARIGTGYSTSTYLVSSTTANAIGFTKMSLSFNAGQSVYLEFGSFTSTATTSAACNFPNRYDY